MHQTPFPVPEYKSPGGGIKVAKTTHLSNIVNSVIFFCAEKYGAGEVFNFATVVIYESGSVATEFSSRNFPYYVGQANLESDNSSPIDIIATVGPDSVSIALINGKYFDLNYGRPYSGSAYERFIS